jgi:PAS domain S-box-containing protein
MGERDFLGRKASSVVPEFATQGLFEICHEVLRTGKPYVGRDAAVKVRRFPGQPLVDTRIDFVFQPLHDETGAANAIFLQGQDITGWKLAEDALRANREELAAALSATEAILDHSHDVICTTDAQGVYTKVSRRAEQLWGYRPEEMVGRHFRDFVHPDDLPRSAGHVAALRAGEPTTSFVNRIVHRSGELVPVMWSSVWSDAHQTTFAIARDMREHLLAEERLRQAQKMEAVGRLTGGVAHDFNNLLTAVIGSAEALNDGLGHEPELQPLAQLILDAAERGAELVSQLLSASRNQPLAPVPVECRAFLDNMVQMLRRTIGEDIEVVVEAGPDELHCVADPSQLTAAVLNLAFNGRDAMPGGGRLVLRAAVHGRARAERWVVISVEDTGEGMAPATKERAFEPFFTTKPPGRGSGLGLSMVDGFAAQSGGRLEIDSEVGRGTCIKLFLPYTAERASPAEPGSIASKPVALARILVVEDDDLVRDQVQRQLVALGYSVTATSDGPEALQRLSENPSVDLLLTDVVMPGGMNGRQLADHARLLQPKLRVLFTSGYTEDEILRTGGLDAEFLPKPYRRADLARKVAEALGHN